MISSLSLRTRWAIPTERKTRRTEKLLFVRLSVCFVRVGGGEREDVLRGFNGNVAHRWIRRVFETTCIIREGIARYTVLQQSCLWPPLCFRGCSVCTKHPGCWQRDELHTKTWDHTVTVTAVFLTAALSHYQNRHMEKTWSRPYFVFLKDVSKVANSAETNWSCY